MRSRYWMVGAACVCLMAGSAWATDLGGVLKGVQDAMNADDKTPAKAVPAEKQPADATKSDPADDMTSMGLKEALNVGISEAVKLVGKEDGFLRNKAIRIPLPGALEKVDKLVRKAGGAELSDALVTKMNRAAEKAAPQALDIFVKAIEGISFGDAAGILNGGDKAATTFLQDRTGTNLKTAFQPIVMSTMEELGLVKLYNDYTGTVGNNPLVQSMLPNLNEYVTEKAVDGLFVMVAEQETKIRQNPAARVTTLLQDVFGALK